MTQQRKLLWSFVRHCKPGMVLIILLGFLNSCSTLLLPLSIGRYMDILFGTQSGKSRALSMLGIHLPPQLDIFFIFFCALLAAKLLTGWAEKYLGSCCAELYAAQLRRMLFSRHTARKAAGKPVAANMLTAYSGEMKTQQQVLLKGVTGFIKEVLFLLLTMYVLFAIQPSLTAVVLVLLPVFYLIHRAGNLRLKTGFSEKRKKQASRFGDTAEVLTAAGAAPEHTVSRFSEKTDELLLSSRRYHLGASFMQVLTPVLLYAMLGVLLYILAVWPGQQLLTSSETVTYILLLMMIFPSLRNILRAEKIWMQGSISARKFLKAV